MEPTERKEEKVEELTDLLSMGLIVPCDEALQAKLSGTSAFKLVPYEVPTHLALYQLGKIALDGSLVDRTNRARVNTVLRVSLREGGAVVIPAIWSNLPQDVFMVRDGRWYRLVLADADGKDPLGWLGKNHQVQRCLDCGGELTPSAEKNREFCSHCGESWYFFEADPHEMEVAFQSR